MERKVESNKKILEEYVQLPPIFRANGFEVVYEKGGGCYELVFQSQEDYNKRRSFVQSMVNTICRSNRLSFFLQLGKVTKVEDGRVYLQIKPTN